MTRFLGISLLVIGSATVAFASVPVSAPELDGGTAISALTLLAGSVVVLRARFRRK